MRDDEYSMYIPPANFQELVRSARLAWNVTSFWMLGAAAAALAAGIVAYSAALVTYGICTAFEVAASYALVGGVQFRGERIGTEELEARERRAMRLLLWCIGVLVAAVVTIAIWMLITRRQPAPSEAGIALAAATLLAMPALRRWRRRLAAALDSVQLEDDAARTWIWIALAATLLAGLLISRFLGWWWVDLWAGLLMIWWVRNEALDADWRRRTRRDNERRT